MEKQKHAGGKPPKYNTPEEMQIIIDEYFENHKEKPTVTGLALALGFLSREGFLYYENEKKEFTDTIKKAKLRIVEILEETLFRNGNVTGIIFNLKNNFNWKDSQDINMNAHIKTEEIPPVSLDDLESQISNETAREK